MKLINLFELTFVDGTKLEAKVQLINKISDCKTITFTLVGNGVNKEIKKLLEKDLRIVCYVAAKFAENKNIVANFIDYVEEQSKKDLEQLTQAF